jgi:hypothetical protein
LSTQAARGEPIAGLPPLRHSSRRQNNALRLHSPTQGSPLMMINVMLQPLIALIAGILILLVPRLLNYIVAIYLIIVGIVGLWPHILA